MTNHLGAAAWTVDAAGSPATGYVSWGNGIGGSASDPFQTAAWGTINPGLRFPGQYYLPETGYNYNYFRDYDPQTGRYLQADPIGLAGGLNAYEYAAGNPLRYQDPFGLSPSLLPGIVVGGVLGGLGGAAGAIATDSDWKAGALRGAAVGALVGTLGPKIGPRVYAQVAVRMAASGVGNVLGQGQILRESDRPFNTGSLVGTMLGAGYSGLIAPASHGAKFSPGLLNYLERAIAGLPGTALSASGAVAGTAIGDYCR